MGALAPKNFLQLFSFLAVLAINASGASENKTETAALLALRDAIVNWPLFAAENVLVGRNDTVAACGWTGVTCTTDGRVIFVNLPCGVGCKTKAVGTLPSALRDLEALSTLDLNSNAFHGPLPSTWSEQGRFPVLQDLLLYGNNLTGGIPWHGASFPLLELLRLDDNQLQGPFPDDLGLPSVRVLRASGNKLDGVLSSKLLGNMPVLEILALQNNLLAGNLILNWTSTTLEQMDLQNNKLMGGIPSTWGLPDAFPFLARLDLSKNPLGGDIPAGWTGPLPKLHSLNLSSSLLSGELPASWAAAGALPATENIDISGNSIRGSVDAWAGFSTLKRLIIRPGNPELCESSQEYRLPFRLCSADDPTCLMVVPDLPSCSAIATKSEAQPAFNADDNGIPVIAVAVPVSVIGALAVILAAALIFKCHRGRRRRSTMEPSPSGLEGQLSLSSPFSAALPVVAMKSSSSRHKRSSFSPNNNACNEQPCSRLVVWLNELVRRTFTRNGNGNGRGSGSNSLSTPNSHSSPTSPSAALNDVEMGSSPEGLVVAPQRQEQMSRGKIARIASQSSRWAEPSETSPEMTVHSPVPDWEIDPGEIEIMRRPDGSEWLLGQGAISRVYKGRRYGVQDIAVKKLRPGSGTHEVTVADFKREIALLRTCRDANIVMFVGAHLSPASMLLVMEYMEGGDLMGALAAGRVTWWRHGRKLAIDVAKGLTYLHARKIAHNNLKSANILLTRGSRTAKICGVGMATVLGEKLREVRGVTTAAWSAPELQEGESSLPRLLEADIYSLGVIMWEICSGETPEPGQLRDLIVPEECPAEARNLILECLHAYQPEHRPTAAQVVARLLATPEAAPRRGTSLRRHEHGDTSTVSSVISTAEGGSSMPRDPFESQGEID